MALPAFDTLKVANRLKSVGVPSAQAEAEAEVLSEIFEVNLKALATKEDLLATKEDLQREIGGLRKDMNAQYESVRNDVDAKFAGVDAKFAGIDAKFAGVDVRFSAMEERFDARFVSMEERFDAKLERMGAVLRQEMSDMKFALIKWIVGLGIAQTGLWFTLKLLPICRGISNAPLPNSSQRRFQRSSARAKTQRRPLTPVNGRALHPIPHRALQRPIHRVPASSFWCAARWLSAIVAPQSSPIELNRRRCPASAR